MGVTDDTSLDEGNSSEGRETRIDIIRKKETEIHSWCLALRSKRKGARETPESGGLESHMEGWVQALSLATGQAWEG